MDIEKLVQTELANLKADLAMGDEIDTDISPRGKTIPHSRKTANARIKFIGTIRHLLGTGEINTIDAGIATRLFGKKTHNLYWIK